jgi:hypothetical protein
MKEGAIPEFKKVQCSILTNMKKLAGWLVRHGLPPAARTTTSPRSICDSLATIAGLAKELGGRISGKAFRSAARSHPAAERRGCDNRRKIAASRNDVN